MDKPRIVISVFGGLIQDVFCSIDNADVVLVDWDQDPDPPFVRDEIVFGTNNCSALVGSFNARSFDDLPGTDDEAAILAAQDKGVIDVALASVS